MTDDRANVEVELAKLLEQCKASYLVRDCRACQIALDLLKPSTAEHAKWMIQTGIAWLVAHGRQDVLVDIMKHKEVQSGDDLHWGSTAAGPDDRGTGTDAPQS